MVPRRPAVVVLALLAVAAAACSDSGNGADAGPTRGTRPGAVTIQGFLFRPASLSVKAGTAVVWTNRDDIPHTVTSGTPPDPAGTFDSGDKTLGQAFTHTFPAAGTFAYFCKNHNSMTGQVTVT